MKQYIGTILSAGAVVALAYHITIPTSSSPPPEEYIEEAGGSAPTSQGGQQIPSETDPQGNPIPNPNDPNIPSGDNAPNQDSAATNFQNIFSDTPSSGRSPTGYNFTTYGYDQQGNPNHNYDTNSAYGLGNKANLLDRYSVAVSPDIIESNGLRGGEAVYIGGNFVGYYDDTTSRSITRTVDIYDPSAQIGSDLKTSNQALTFGESRGLTPYPYGEPGRLPRRN